MGSAVNQAPGGCQCGCAFTVSGNVKGCNSLNAPGITVEAHDATAGGTLLGTTTTDASGNYTLSGSGAIVGNDVVISFKHTRVTTANSTLTYLGSGSLGTTHWRCLATTSGVDASLTTPATGYHCSDICALPLADTLNGTDLIMGGSPVLTWTIGKTWIGTASGSYGACNGCTPGTYTFTYQFNGANGAMNVQWNTNDLTCPHAGGTFSIGTPLTGTVNACPPSFSVSYVPTSPGPASQPYCVAAGTHVMDLTE